MKRLRTLLVVMMVTNTLPDKHEEPIKEEPLKPEQSEKPREYRQPKTGI